MLYMLPVSLFGNATAASELPEMATAIGTPAEIGAKIKGRLVAGMDRIAFFIVPSAVAFLVLGDVLAATLYQTGHFSQSDAAAVWVLLIGCSVGILATTQSRLCVSAFWAMHDARTPTRFAVIRVALTAILGYVSVFPLREAFDLTPAVAGAFLVGTAGFSGWLEFLLIKRALSKKIGEFHLDHKAMARCWALALASAAAAFGLKRLLPDLPPLIKGLLVLGLYGGLYLGGSVAVGAEHATVFLRKLRRRA
jgi:putative peptidoglycan lipid II flippase